MAERERIAITGAKGTIGKVLMEGLKDYYDLKPLDLPQMDVRDLERLTDEFQGQSAVIHLAWDTKTENWQSGKINPDNTVMTFNLYQAATRAGVKRVIMASSVHADQCTTWKSQDLLTVDRIPVPTSPYGASKVFMEALGRFFAKKGLEVVCIRFGGVNEENKPADNDPGEKAVWFAHEDCIELVRSCLQAEKIPNNFLIIYGVSDNKNRIHDYSNPLDWKPKKQQPLNLNQLGPQFRK